MHHLRYEVYITFCFTCSVCIYQYTGDIFADFSLRVMENGAILSSQSSRPAILIDPDGDGCKWLQKHIWEDKSVKLILIDMEKRLCLRRFA